MPVFPNYMPVFPNYMPVIPNYVLIFPIKLRAHVLISQVCCLHFSFLELRVPIRDASNFCFIHYRYNPLAITGVAKFLSFYQNFYAASDIFSTTFQTSYPLGDLDPVRYLRSCSWKIAGYIKSHLEHRRF